MVVLVTQIRYFAWEAIGMGRKADIWNIWQSIFYYSLFYESEFK